jgi:nicotinamide-nucleotide amidase
MVGVNADDIVEFGAVSIEVARQMAQGSLQLIDGDPSIHISVAVTGIAGPDGGSSSKPLGTVCFAWAMKGHETQVHREQFVGNRDQVRQQSARMAMRGVTRFD